MSALLFFRPLFARRAGPLALALLLSLATVAAGVALLGVSGWFITAAALSAAGVAFNLFGPSALVRGLSLLRILSRYGEKLIGHDATLRLLADLRGWLFGRLFARLPLADRHGALVGRLTADVDALDTVFLVALGPMLTALAAGAGVSWLLYAWIPGAGLVQAAGMTAAALLVPAVLIAATRGSGERLVAAAAAARTAVLDAIDGHADLVALGAAAPARQRFATTVAALGRARRATGTAGALAAGAVQACAGLTLTGVLWFGLEALAAGSIGGPLLAGLLLASLASFEVTGAIVRSTARLGAAAAAARHLRAIANAPAPVAEPVRPVVLPHGGDAAFAGVTFGHDPARPVLHGIDLRLAAGDRVALVGPSGSGKSTLLALLLRLHDPQAGTVSIAGSDLRTVPQADLHRRVALLSQDAPVFLGTIRENLLLGRSGATDADLWEALRAARLDETVRGLPDGLETFLGETGRTLSTGQARRLCLARALLSPAAILSLDEPTAGLDPETERDFLADLARATAGRTVLLATHAALPPGTVDRVYRLTAGRLGDAEAA